MGGWEEGSMGVWEHRSMGARLLISFYVVKGCQGKHPVAS